ncbi:flagellar hook-length control protein FliK [Massilia cavernae]|uniref:Flagellar hook-length control protein FliK n=2 Tax=Massilia cavernae TaxID=2320864 RepID=A0A418XSW7_9BURK|nr:flagellar hook-length control protein FliK [Massilia cavernae]
MTQRQNLAAPAPQAQPQVQAKPAAQAKQADKAPTAKQEASKPAQADAARQPAERAETGESTEAAAGAKDSKAAAAEEKPAGQATAEAAARASEMPVTDMLALVASFNQLQGAVPKEALASEALPAGGAAAIVQDVEAVQPDLSGQLIQGAELALGDQQPAAAKGQDALSQGVAAATDSGAQAGAELPAELKAEPSKFANVLMRERAEPAPLKEAPAAAPLAAPAAQASLNIAQAAAGVATDKISARVGTPAWDNQIGQKIVWMVAGKDQSATLTLNPPDLGPVQVVLNVTNDQASVAFSSSQLEVRQALENAMPKLREMLDESGIALGNATVDAGTHDQRQAEGERQAGGAGSGGRFAGNGNGGSADAAAAPVARPVASGSLPGTVDIFA